MIGSVSVRHDPMDAIEETLNAEPIEQLVLHVRESPLAKRLHQDLTDRLSHLGLPIAVIDHPGPSAA